MQGLEAVNSVVKGKFLFKFVDMTQKNLIKLSSEIANKIDNHGFDYTGNAW